MWYSKYMRKFLYLVSLIGIVIIGLFFTPIPSFAQTEPEMLGLNCGVPDEPGKNACCSTGSGPVFPHIPGESILSVIPIIGDVFSTKNQIEQQIGDIRSKYAQQCVQGAYPQGSGSSCICEFNDTEPVIPKMVELCEDYIDPAKYGSTITAERRQQLEEARSDCMDCAASGSYYSGLGCIPLNTETFISQFIFIYGLGFAGAIALLCIIFSAIRMQISKGNPEKIQAAREMLTSCIIGLILILFSVFILRLIGVDVLGLPGFGAS